MKIFTKLLTACLVLGTTIGCTQTKASPFNIELIEQAQILNLKNVDATVITSGQPTKEQIKIVFNSGVKHIINLRPASEQDWDEEVDRKSVV